MCLRLPLGLRITILLCSIWNSYSREIKIATILPKDQKWMFSINRVAPAIEYAIERVMDTPNMLINHTFSVKYDDSGCSIAHGMDRAINFYLQKEVDVFFGPVCDFAAAPVMRQCRFWNLPVITSGAMARDFVVERKTSYTHLTRVGAVNFASLTGFFTKLFDEFSFSKLKFIFNSRGQDNHVFYFCHLAVEFLVYTFKSSVTRVKADHKAFDYDSDIPDWLTTEVGLDYAGK